MMIVINLLVCLSLPSGLPHMEHNRIFNIFKFVLRDTYQHAQVQVAAPTKVAGGRGRGGEQRALGLAMRSLPSSVCDV